MRFPSLENHPEEQISPQSLKLRDDPKFAATKMAIFQYTAVAVFLFLVTGFWELQIKNPEIYSERAERNRIKELPIVAPRGKIVPLRPITTRTKAINAPQRVTNG